MMRSSEAINTVTKLGKRLPRKVKGEAIACKTAGIVAPIEAATAIDNTKPSAIPKIQPRKIRIGIF